MWNEYFYNAEIIGYDINPNAKKFEQKKYSSSACIAQAKKFSRAEFERKMREEIEKLTPH